jgi:selenocysteine lyase/cysteine desulfurase
VNPDYDIASMRRCIPALASMIPMCNCSQSPQTEATLAAAERYLESWRTRGMDWEEWMDEVGRAKAAFAALINASPGDIAVFSSVSDATSAVASAIEFSGHRRDVLATEAEFPAIGHVWLAQEQRGARVRWIGVKEGRVDPAEYERRVNDDTAIVSACHGYYLNGALQDISAIAKVAHENGALLFVDAYQSAGAVPIDVKASEVDFLASGTLKYLMGIPGIAFLYVRPERVDRLHPTVTGWFGRENPYAFEVNKLDWAPNARRFDTGTPPIINAYIARAGIEMITQIGVAKIRAWHEQLSDRLIDGAELRGLRVSAPPRHSSKTANTAIEVKDAPAVEEAMRRKGVLASARGSVIRLAPHFYNTADDIDASLDVLAAVTRA